MARQSAGGLMLDTCVRCEGIWFDRGELEAFARTAAAERIAARIGTGAPRPTGGEALACPRCERPTLHSYRLETVVPTRCTDCGGVYLDGDDVRALRGRRPLYQRVDPEPPSRAATAAGYVAGAGAQVAVETALELALRAAVAVLTPR
jgi:Zn-finger nucleic acid-binding protein